MLLEICTRDSLTSEFMAVRNHYAEPTYLIDVFRYYTVITTFKEERAYTDCGSHVILLRLVYLQYFLTSYLYTSYLLRYSATMIVLSTLSCSTQHNGAGHKKGIQKIVNSSRLRATEYSGTIYIDCINYLWPYSFTSIWLP